jgi:gamma-glutamylcyclotransferase (GGCT)/AIG2-like uncharacterized protein YtfP
MHVFAYGTLMFPEVWREVTGLNSVGVEGLLQGFAAYRVRDAVFPGIIRSPGSVVPGILYCDVPPAPVDQLDRFEDDFYVREQVTVKTLDGRLHEAEAYVVLPKNSHVLTTEIWTRESFLASGGLEEFVANFAGFGRVAE